MFRAIVIFIFYVFWLMDMRVFVLVNLKKLSGISLYEVFCENIRGFNLRNLNLFFYGVNMNVM